MKVRNVRNSEKREKTTNCNCLVSSLQWIVYKYVCLTVQSIMSSYWNKKDLNQLLPQNNKGLKRHLGCFEFVFLLVQ